MNREQELKSRYVSDMEQKASSNNRCRVCGSKLSLMNMGVICASCRIEENNRD